MPVPFRILEKENIECIFHLLYIIIQKIDLLICIIIDFHSLFKMSKPSPMNIQFTPYQWCRWVISHSCFADPFTGKRTQKGDTRWILAHPLYEQYALLSPGDPRRVHLYNPYVLLHYLSTCQKKGIVHEELIPQLPSLQSQVWEIIK